MNQKDFARRASIALFVLLVLALIPIGCQKKVSVRTGELIECRYGHVIKEDIKTIEVPQADVGRYGVRKLIKVCGNHLKAEDLYSQARKAIKDGDINKALDKLKNILKIDPEFRDAAQLIAKLTPKDSPDKVTVKSGVRKICTHGELIDDDIKELDVLATQADKYTVQEVRITCSKHKEVDDLIAKAKAAQAQGKKASAESYLRQALTKDPGTIEAKDMLAELTKPVSSPSNGNIIQRAAESIDNAVGAVIPGASSSGTSEENQSSGGSSQNSSSGGSAGSDSAQDSDSQSSPSLGLAERIPKTMNGYTRVAHTSEDIAATAMFTSGQDTFVSFQIKQHANEQDAKKEIQATSQTYAEYQSSEVIRNKDGVFGTDGKEFAYMGWADGAVTYEVEMMRDGQEPQTLHEEILTISNLTK